MKKKERMSMEKKRKWMNAMALLLTAVMVLAGCGTQEQGQDGQVSGDEITVTFYDADGTTVLKTEQIAKGGTAEPFTPDKEGYEFKGWYGTPQMQHEFDFSQPLNEDTPIFGGFVQFQEDTREFVILGNGNSPLMLVSSWGANINEEHKMAKDQKTNEYTITLDLYEGDEFQIAINSSWHHQRGYGYLDTISQDGTDYFINSGGVGEVSVKKANIKVAVSGNYTITLTTYPVDDIYETDNDYYTEESKDNFNMNPYDTITWTYNGEPVQEAEEMQANYYIKGAGITKWQDIYTERTGFMVDSGIHTLTIALKEGEEFLFTSLMTSGSDMYVGNEYIRYNNLDEAGGELFDASESYNMIARADGVYTFTYDPESTVLAAVCDTGKFLPEYEYYMKGSFGDTNWGTEGNADYRLAETQPGSYGYVLEGLAVEAGDEMGLQSMEDGERILFINCYSMAAAADDNANGDFEPHSNGYGNIVAKESGEYTVEYDAYTGILIFRK